MTKIVIISLIEKPQQDLGYFLLAMLTYILTMLIQFIAKIVYFTEILTSWFMSISQCLLRGENLRYYVVPAALPTSKLNNY